jgi:hypothetical protein
MEKLYFGDLNSRHIGHSGGERETCINRKKVVVVVVGASVNSISSSDDGDDIYFVGSTLVRL